MKVNGKDYPIYYGKYKMFETTNQKMLEILKPIYSFLVPWNTGWVAGIPSDHDLMICFYNPRYILDNRKV